MFFAASKIFWAIIEPVTFLVLAASAGVALAFTRWAKAGRRLAALAMLGLALILFTPLGVALLRTLEDRFPPPAADLPAPTGIIVLGGGLNESKSEARGQIILNEDGMRLIAGLELARRYPSARLIFSGGAANFMEETPPEAIGVRKLWQDLGGPAERTSFESKSRNTWENAIYTRDLVQPKPGDTWLLVTSAWHMPRAMGIFRKVGFDVTAWPVAYRTFGYNRDWGPAAPADRIANFDWAIREWIGLIAYRLTGKTNALFPGP